MGVGAGQRGARKLLLVTLTATASQRANFRFDVGGVEGSGWWRGLGV